MLGNGRNSYTLPGIGSRASRAAQSGPLGVVTSDADGNLGVDYSMGSVLSDIGSDLRDTMDRTRTNRDGVAMAMALDTPYVPDTKQFAMSGGIGFFEGSQALAVSGAYRIDGNTQVDAGFAYGFDSESLGGRVGVTYSW